MTSVGPKISQHWLASCECSTVNTYVFLSLQIPLIFFIVEIMCKYRVNKINQIFHDRKFVCSVAVFSSSHEIRKRHVFRTHVREIHDPTLMVRYFARIINFVFDEIDHAFAHQPQLELKISHTTNFALT